MKLYRCKNKTHTKKSSTKTEGGFCAVPDLRHATTEHQKLNKAVIPKTDVLSFFKDRI